jgi:hypothetical protein
MNAEQGCLESTLTIISIITEDTHTCMQTHNHVFFCFFCFALPRLALEGTYLNGMALRLSVWGTKALLDDLHQKG